ncbi:TetR/AcrR family transcriptional regulator [Nocardioides stalactiti]|uniref:TetR/AcrR family transcriptional regulator n=1 Tax=Nocardioides stalactiti TaxID=2755356 RepID=UPI001FE8D42E|nr:TetR/AcrR family transcriptional regulator [Nocardioides stalactiti]
MAAKLYGAAELIAERGIGDAKIDEIAEAAGIPRATLYYYFTGKDEILAFLLHDMLDLVAGEVGTAVAGTGTARDRLKAVVGAQLSVMLENPAVCRALVGELGRASRLPDLAKALQMAFHEPVERLLEEGVEDGTLRKLDNPFAAALSVFGAVTVAGLTHAVAGLSSDPATVANEVCDVILGGLQTET